MESDNFQTIIRKYVKAAATELYDKDIEVYFLEYLVRMKNCIAIYLYMRIKNNGNKIIK